MTDKIFIGGFAVGLVIGFSLMTGTIYLEKECKQEISQKDTSFGSFMKIVDEMISE